MLNPELLLGQLDVGALVPEEYAEFRPMVVDALVFFLRHLSHARLAAILADQASLAQRAQADLPTRVVHFMHQCPSLHKLGQVIARHRALDPGFRRNLQALESMEPRTPAQQLQPRIRRELSSAVEQYHIRFGDAALAEASVAVVLPVSWREPGGPGTERQGVLKVLKPGVGRRLQQDLRILGELADHFDRQRAAGKVPAAEYREVFDEVRQLLTHEVRLWQEQAHLTAAAAQYASEAQVQIPRLLPFSTPRLTAMERVDGVKVTECSAVAPLSRRRLAENIVRYLLTDVVFSRQASVMFHADPHAGNLFATGDGRLAILDWSLTGSLGRQDRAQLMQVLIGAVTQDAQRMCRAIDLLSAGRADPERVRAFVRDALRELRRGRVPGVGWLMRLLDGLFRRGVAFPANLLLFRKSYFTLEGVVADVCGDCTVEQILTEQAAGRLADEWPQRLLSPLNGREFATQLSNGDLLHVAASIPGTLARLWSGFWLHCADRLASGC